MKKEFLILLVTLISSSCGQTEQAQASFNTDDMIIRISEIEIDPNHLNEYVAILKKESAASVALEPGVISIYPMFQKETPAEIRILEIYADTNAYKSHLQTPHFRKYKSTTMEMVKSLKLVDMKAIDGETMSKIFKKPGLSKTDIRE